MSTISDAKRALRREMTARRHQLQAGGGLAAARAAGAQFRSWWRPETGQVVSGYWSVRSELDPAPLLDQLAVLGCRIALPVVVGPGAALVFRGWTPAAAMVTSSFGIPEPSPANPPLRPDIALLPLLAFDASGYRLGYGAGHYDRTLARLRQDGRPVVAVGFGFAGQEVARVPRDAHDERLDLIVTEKEVRSFV